MEGRPRGVDEGGLVKFKERLKRRCAKGSRETGESHHSAAAAYVVWSSLKALQASLRPAALAMAGPTTPAGGAHEGEGASPRGGNPAFGGGGQITTVPVALQKA